MFQAQRVTAPTLVKTQQLSASPAHRQTAIVRTLIDEMERCERSVELSDQLNLQMIDELRRLARRVLDVADALERDRICEADVPSGIRLRSSL